MIISYNKLVRDRIPEIITSKNKTPHYHIANDEEYRELLKDKLIEEVEEFLESQSIEEIADIQEVIEAILLFKKRQNDIHKIKSDKAESRWKFEKRIILEKVEE